MTETTRCAKCGAMKPISQFDSRFVGKPVRLTCAACRGVPSEGADKWRAAWERRRANEQRRAEEFAARQAAEIAHQRQREEEERRRMAWRQRLAEQGFTEEDVAAIEHIHYRLLRGGNGISNSWTTIKERFYALHPPYIGGQWRPKVSAATREAVYRRQDGCCLYCGRALLALDVWKPDRRRELDRRLWHNSADSGVPELDHLTPLSRGGKHTVDNLAYTCKRCNHIKLIRTREEFDAMPNDAITILEGFGLPVPWIAEGIRLEAQGYTGFAEGRGLQI